MITRYLYTVRRHESNVHRYPISRESISNIWIKISKSKDSEMKICKKTMTSGSEWDTVQFYEEDSEWLKRYNFTQLKSEYIKKLYILKDCIDENVINQVLSIKVK